MSVGRQTCSGLGATRAGDPAGGEPPGETPSRAPRRSETLDEHGFGLILGSHPRQGIEAECARRGKDEVVQGCVHLILGQDVDPALLMVLGGPGATKFLDGNSHEDGYWLRVWGARGLLWTWDDTAVVAIDVALHDQAWRVREMALKVVRRHLLEDLRQAASLLRNDPVPRVRQAADRATVVLRRRRLTSRA
jgi:hypothetical protein